MLAINLTLYSASAVLVWNWVHFLLCLYRKSKFEGRRLLLESLAGLLLLSLFLILPGFLTDHQPLTSRAEIFGLYSWSILAVFLLLTRFNSLKSMGSLVLPVALLFLSLSFYQLSADSFSTQSEVTKNTPFWIHIFFIVVAYGSFTVTFLMAVGYLRSEHQLRAKSVDGFFFMLPSLEDLDGALQQSIWIGLGSLLSGILLAFLSGSLKGTLGTFWFLDPNVLGAIFTGVIYGTILFIRRRALFTNRRIAYLAISGFVFIGILFLSMNFLTQMHHFM
ncbi:MAG: cytochrome c biogenesis protein CcsA [bacterium]